MSAAKPTPDWILERFALSELPEPEASETRLRIQGDAELASRLECLHESNRELLFLHPPSKHLPAIRRRLRASKARMLAPTLVLAPAAAAALLVLRMPATTVPGPIALQAQTERAKGLSPHLLAFKVASGAAEQLADGAQVTPGDVVQLQYVAAGRGYGTIVSLDGRGEVTLHWPEDPGGSTRLSPEGPISLPHAFQLDDAPAYECFVFISSEVPIAVEQVLEAAQGLAGPAAGDHPLALPAAWEQYSLCLKKEHP